MPSTSAFTSAPPSAAALPLSNHTAFRRLPHSPPTSFVRSPFASSGSSTHSSFGPPPSPSTTPAAVDLAAFSQLLKSSRSSSFPLFDSLLLNQLTNRTAPTSFTHPANGNAGTSTAASTSTAAQSLASRSDANPLGRLGSPPLPPSHWFAARPSTSAAVLQTMPEVEDVELAEGTSAGTECHESCCTKRALPTLPYFPTHFLRGTVLQMPDDSNKVVEALHLDDFEETAVTADNHEMGMEIGRVMTISTSVGGQVLSITFEVEEKQEDGSVLLYTSDLRVPIEYPFFEMQKRWCSRCPSKTRALYGIECAPLEIGDLCVLLTSFDDEEEEDEDAEEPSTPVPVPETSKAKQRPTPATSTAPPAGGGPSRSYFRQPDIQMDDHVSI
ncbi:AXH domain-containing protein [Aphelenchoides fujianensis]|nr:AXH domain-containing protein [Aphelenchoides fujianensis]